MQDMRHGRDMRVAGIAALLDSNADNLWTLWGRRHQAAFCSVGLAAIWHTGSMSNPPAKPRLVPCHFTVEDLQLIEWSCREKAQRARKDAKSDTTPSSIEAFTATATKYEALASRIQRLKEIGR
jgi:hypothetical protein